MKDARAVHAIRIEHNSKRVVVKFDGHVLASSTQALTMREGALPLVQYIPRADVNMSLLVRTSHASHCPYKGDAAYYSIVSGARESQNAVWTYEAPYEAVAAIKDLVAFYPQRVDSIEEEPV